MCSLAVEQPKQRRDHGGGGKRNLAGMVRQLSGTARLYLCRASHLTSGSSDVDAASASAAVPTPAISRPRCGQNVAQVSALVHPARQCERADTHPDAAAGGGLLARCSCRRKAASGGAAQPAPGGEAKHCHANGKPSLAALRSRGRCKHLGSARVQLTLVRTSYGKDKKQEQERKARFSKARPLPATLPSQPCEEATVYRQNDAGHPGASG